MRISSIDITIHLDTHHKFEDVQKFILEEALKDVFQPIYQFKYNQKLESFNSEELDKEFKVTKINADLYKDQSFELNIRKDDKNYHQDLMLCGSFRLKRNDLTYFDIFNFLLPTVGEKDGELKLEFRTLDPALTVDIVYYESEFSSEPTFYVSLKASQGLWGNRHKWLEAMKKIIDIQCKDNKVAKKWGQDTKFVEDLKDWSRRMEVLETESLMLEEARQKIWDTARVIRERFSESEYAIYISPKISSRIDRQFDMSVFHCNKLPDQVGNLPDDFWYKLAWHECFDWDAPELLEKRAVKYWTTHEDDEGFLDMISIGAAGWKGTWPTVVKIMTKRPETPAMIKRLISFTADINWPGAGEAWDHLLNVVGMRAIPIINENIKWAKKHSDDDWKDNLTWIKDDILEKYGEK